MLEGEAIDSAQELVGRLRRVPTAAGHGRRGEAAEERGGVEDSRRFVALPGPQQGGERGKRAIVQRDGLP